MTGNGHFGGDHGNGGPAGWSSIWYSLTRPPRVIERGSTRVKCGAARDRTRPQEVSAP